MPVLPHDYCSDAAAATKSMNPIKTLLADDHTIVREGLRALLLADGGIHVVGEARNGREAVELAVELRPDVVVMDIAMPLLNGLEATRQIVAARPGTKVLILSAHSDDAYIDRVIAVLRLVCLSASGWAEEFAAASAATAAPGMSLLLASMAMDMRAIV